MGKKRTGISRSTRPYVRKPATWSTNTNEDIVGLAKKGYTPSQIGASLRDSQGVPNIHAVTGHNLIRILANRGLAPKIPEDLYHLIQKAVTMKKHLDRNKKDKNTQYHLQLIESRILKLIRFYKKIRTLPPTWKYDPIKAVSMVQ